MNRVLIVPAAGRGSRLGSELPKFLVPVNGRPMIEFILDRYRGMVTRFLVVVSPAAMAEAQTSLATRADKIELLVQDSPTGMLDAILVPRPRVSELAPDEIWITWCDQVAMNQATVDRVAWAMETAPAPAMALPTVRGEQPYIHFDRGPSGAISGVRQRREADVMPAEGEGDAGLFALAAAAYLEELPRFAAAAPRGRITGERNFLPFIPWLAGRSRVATVPVIDPMEAVGINTPDELARVARYLARTS